MMAACPGTSTYWSPAIRSTSDFPPPAAPPYSASSTPNEERHRKKACFAVGWWGTYRLGRRGVSIAFVCGLR